MTAVPATMTLAEDDAALVRDLAGGNLEALGDLFERFEPNIRRYLLRVGVTESDVDDLVQATFLEVVRAAPRFDPSYPVRTWLFGIATIMVRRHRRSVARAAARLVTWTGLVRAESAPSPDDVYDGDEALRRFAASFERLSRKKREVFALVTIEGLSGEEAARALGIPVNTVWTRLHHARADLRAAISGEGER
jgi:RNA polymerase sigma-70 factor (ECF subfamily)